MWHQVWFVVDGGNFHRSYVDGVVDETAQTKDVNHKTTFKIGKAYTGALPDTARYFQGQMADFRIYNRIVLPAEVIHDYEITREAVTAWARRKPIKIPYTPAPAVGGGGGIRNPMGGPMRLRTPMGAA